jgi:hypothetical protein
MPDTYLTILRVLHVVFGIVATFVLFPIQITNRKGGRQHRRVGRWVIWVSTAIAVTGLLMLIDPLFLERFWPVEAERLGRAALFEHTAYEPLFFLFLVVTLLYYVYSGARIWTRTAAADREGRVPSNAADWTLTGVAGAFALVYLALGIHDLPSGQRYAIDLLGSSLTLLPFVVADLVSFVPRWTVRLVRWWWLLHVLKLFNAWHGLIDAFVLRLEVQYRWVLAHRPLVTRGIWLLEVVVIVLTLRAVRTGRFDPDQGRRRALLAGRAPAGDPSA